MLSRLPALALGFVLAAASVRAAEDCSDLARIPDCPPAASPCTSGTCPPQDCSTCTAAFDDDGDCALDEELLDGAEDDGDGLVDEDISCLVSCDPLGYACPTTPVDAAALQVLDPLDGMVVLPLAVHRYGCAGAASTTVLGLRIEPDPDRPHPACDTWQVRQSDVATCLQFFDLRIANACEVQSGDDEPPGWDVGSCP